MRKNGYYWVKMSFGGGEWVIEKWHDGKWEYRGDYDYFMSFVLEVDENRIEYHPKGERFPDLQEEKDPDEMPLI